MINLKMDRFKNFKIAAFKKARMLYSKFYILKS